MIDPGPAGYSYNKVTLAVAVTYFKYEFFLKRASKNQPIQDHAKSSTSKSS